MVFKSQVLFGLPRWSELCGILGQVQGKTRR